MYQAKILLDSVNPAGHRLTTWELSYPRFVHSELMTHRVFSRNSASSRAIPSEKLIQRIIDDPAMPVWWGKNQAGMQAQEELDIDDIDYAKEVWLEARDLMIKFNQQMQKIGLHKQIANRMLEPWMYITVILSATTFDNWFKLRCHKDAQPEIKHLADMMLEEYKKNNPFPRAYGDWHLPLVNGEDYELINNQADTEKLYMPTWGINKLKKISVGRCARVSYLTHDGKRDIQADIDLHDRLVTSGHWSPFEHVAMADSVNFNHGNFIGWLQYRKQFEGESGC